MASEVTDAEVHETASEMNLPLEYVKAVYDETGKQGESPSTPPAEPEQPAPKAEEQEPASSGEVSISNALANRAKSYGLDPEKFASSEALQDQIDDYDRQLLQSVQQPQQQPQQTQPTQQVSQQQARDAMWQQQEAARAAQQQQVQQQAQQGLPSFKVESDDYDEDDLQPFNTALQSVADYFQNQMQQMASVIQQQNQYLQHYAQETQAKQIEQTNAAFDAAVDEIGYGQFGKGRYEDLTTEEQAARQKLMDTATSLVQVYGQRGIPVPDMPELVQSAFRLGFAEESKQANQAELKEKITARSRQRLGTGVNHRPERARKWNGPPEQDPYLIGKFKELESEQDFR